MFRETQRPLSLAEASLHGLCASLNTPVINIEDMRVGPAKAAILVFADEQGGIGLAVALRSLENAQVKVFVYHGDLDPMLPPESTMESALTFAEGMGFLFDEDIVARDASGRSQAFRHWQALVGDSTQDAGEAPVAAPPDAVPELIVGDDELLLDDEVLAEFAAEGDGGFTIADDELSFASEDLDPELPPSIALEGEPAAEPAVQPQVRLSKFRGRSEAAPPAGGEKRPARKRRVAKKAAPEPTERPEESTGGNELGRISLVQVRLGGGADRPSPLARLLGSF